MKLFDSELKVMEILWRSGDTAARDIAEELGHTADWSKTTAYTVIKKCVGKGAVSRSEPNFICHAEISRREVQEYETSELIEIAYSICLNPIFFIGFYFVSVIIVYHIRPRMSIDLHKKADF